MMHKILQYFILLIILQLISSCAHKYIGPDPAVLSVFDLTDQDQLLVVKVTKTKWTGFHPENEDCDNCIHWSYYYVHEAKVLDVLNGEYKDKTIKFAMLSHTDYIKEIKREWYVKLKPFKNMETSKKLGALYYVDKQSSRISLNK